MYISKARVLLDKDNKCVKADDPSGVQVLAGFKGAKVSEKIIANVKGAEGFFDTDAGTEHRVAASKRVVAEADASTAKAAVIKK